MSFFFWVGTALGTVVGFLHMLQVLLVRWGRPGLNSYKTLWQALWTFVLWAAFGAYVLAFWLLGALCLVAARLLKSKSNAQ